MTRYLFAMQHSSADASCAAACTSAPKMSLCLFDTAALAVSFLFLRLILVRIILPLLAKT